MSSSVNLETVLEVTRVVASLSLSTSIVIILAWKSPQLAKEFFAFIRALIKDFRTPPRGGRKL